MERSEYNNIFDNASKHIEAAKQLSENQMFGFAISHLILAIEELGKYLAIMLKSVNNYYFDDVINHPKGKSIFKSHTTKHKLIKDFYQACSDVNTSKFFESLLMKSQGKKNSGDPAISENKFQPWSLFFNLASKHFNISEKKSQAFNKWLDNANNNKNDGFYVDWKNDQIKTPDSFKVDDYNSALEYASTLLKQIEFMKSVDMTDNEILEWQRKN